MSHASLCALTQCLELQLLHTAESNTDHDHDFSVRRSAVTDGFLTLFVRKCGTVTCKDL